ncbi:MAG: alpha/beta hydrolase [Clostridiales bacterium]|nr:alpha/beta hydrolase [Clostridiales bacterium]
MLKKEAAVFDNPLGQHVEVDGHNMTVYVEGEGEHTLVFLSGSGTACPILDFKALYSLLSDDYRIVVIEKFGYGFSDVVDGDRDFDTILRQDREALSILGIEGPFILCPHSMSGVEALLWAQKFPDEVEAIAGLDMAVPEHYDIIDGSSGSGTGLNMLVDMLRGSGLLRLLGDDFIIPCAEHLTEDEIRIYRQIVYARILNENVINEGEWTDEVCDEIRSNTIPDIPIILFISDGTGGTGLDTETWRGCTYDFAESRDNVEIVELNCGHYVHDFESERISADMREFIESLTHL